MKKNLLAVLAIVIAVAGVAYTTPKKSEARHACDSLYWIKVASVQSNPCTNPVLVQPSDVDSDGFVTTSDLSTDFLTTADYVTAETSGALFGCKNQTTVCCAYGFRLNQLQVISGKIVPITGQTPVCIIKKANP